MKNKILIENISEIKNNHTDVFEQVFMKLDTINDNNRYYPKQQFINNLSRLKQLIKENRLLGELGHPLTEDINRIYTVDLKEVQIMITDLEIKNNTVYGKFKILNTPNGIILKNLIENGVKVGISLRGVGDVQKKVIENKTVEYVIPDTFEIVCWDIVHTPGFSEQLIITENKKIGSVQYSNLKNTKSLDEYISVQFLTKLRKML